MRGGVVHGQYPELRLDGPQSVSSTGQMLPTSPWKAIWQSLVEWLGVESSQLDHVMPNLARFPSEHTLGDNDVFV